MGNAAVAAPRAQLSRAVLLIVTGVSLFAVIDALAKLLVRDFSAVQIVWARYAFFLLPLALIIGPWRWRRLLRVDTAALQLGRGLIPIAASLVLVFAFRWVPLADATALIFIGPLLTVLLAMLLLGERATVHRWAAVAGGFTGVVVIVRPGGAAFDPALLLPLGAAVMFAIFHVTTRMLGHVDARTTVLYTALVGTVVTTLAVPFVWRMPTALDWVILVASGILHGLAHVCVIRGFALAEASVLAPFNYTQIVMATVLGLVLFGEFPDAATLVGIAVIVGSGLYVYFAERRC